MKPTLLVGIAILAGQAVAAQTARDSTSAPISDVRYDVTFMRSNAQARQIEVAMTFATTSSSPVVLSLPAWTPGAYEITIFARLIVGFTATSDGKPLVWDKLDFD